VHRAINRDEPRIIAGRGLFITGISAYPLRLLGWIMRVDAAASGVRLYVVAGFKASLGLI
jgi:hypothetical protein